MIAALYGTVQTARLDGYVQLRCGPVLLELTLPAAQASLLVEGEETELHTYLYLSTASDQLRLYGFTSAAARELFSALITASGVGPRVALGLLDLGVAPLVAALRDSDEKTLTQVSGVGPKLAKRVILELSEKIGKEFAALAQEGMGTAPRRGSVADSALDAVVALGFSRQRAEQALAEVRRDYSGDDAPLLIRRILATLAG